jgi:isoleucyl-tRNA synthetase
MAPVLSFTAEEVWSYLPEAEREAESIHLTPFPMEDPAWVDETLAERWDRLLTLRGEVTKALERARQAQVIGHPLDARVRLLAPEKWGALLQSYEPLLPALFIVSQASRTDRPEGREGFASEVIPGLRIWVDKAAGEKCERCWNYREEVGQSANHPTLCGRCEQAVAEIR